MNPPSTAFVLPPQPLLGTDVSAYVLLTLSLIYAVLWWRDLERGILWLAAAFGIIGFWWATTRLHLPQGVYIDHQGWAVLQFLGVSCFVVGLIEYLDLPSRLRRLVLPVLLLFPLAGLVGVLASVFVPIPRSSLVLFVTGPLMGLGGLALWSTRLEPRAGHGVVGLALLTIPVTGLVAVLTGTDVVLIRYTSALPLILFGLVLLTVSLQRRRRALEAEIERRGAAESKLAALNDSLEQQVQQRTAELQEMVAGLESFNRSVSHDLRGPLGGISQLAGMAEQALQRGDEAAVRRMLPVIRRQSDVSEQLVHALLALARVGDAPMHIQRIELDALARECAEMIRLARRGEDTPPVDVEGLPALDGDLALLRAVFTNLIGNAVKFSAGRPEGRVTVVAEDDRGADAVTVHVSDNGEGFDEEASARLFKPFQRLHGARFEGHGVGLSIVRRAVERHGGRVWARGRPGAGATFSFTLPKAQPAAPA